MKFRILRNRGGKFQPQERIFLIWWNFYTGYTDHLVEFDTIEKADEYIKDKINYRMKFVNLKDVVVKTYN
jgi:hypothetical protein